MAALQQSAANRDLQTERRPFKGSLLGAAMPRRRSKSTATYTTPKTSNEATPCKDKPKRSNRLVKWTLNAAAGGVVGSLAYEYFVKDLIPKLPQYIDKICRFIPGYTEATSISLLLGAAAVFGIGYLANKFYHSRKRG